MWRTFTIFAESVVFSASVVVAGCLTAIVAITGFMFTALYLDFYSTSIIPEAFNSASAGEHVVVKFGLLEMESTETLISRSMVGVGERLETEVINIKNCQSGLGIKIAGGKSSLGTHFGIFVKKVLSGGAADLDGRLREGDQLLEVNGYSLIGLSNDKAMSILRNSAQSNNAKLLINRDIQARAEFSKLMTALNGGMSPLPSGATNGSSGPALMRSSRTSTPSPTLGKRSWVMNGGRMSPLVGGRHGSPMLSPSNSDDRPSASLQRMYSMDLPSVPVGPTVVQNTPGAFEPPSYSSTLQKLATPTSRTMYNPHLTANSFERSTPYSTNQLTAEQQSVSSEVTNDSGLPTDRHSASSSPTFEHPTGEVQSIRIAHSRGLGLCIVGGTNRTEGPHIYIDDIIEGGDAHKDGRLKNGDRLMYINSETLVGITHEQAKSLLTRFKLRGQDAEITFIRGGLRPDSQISNGVLNLPHSSPRETLQNVLDEVDTQELQLNLNGIENSNSTPSPTRSFQGSEADLSNTDFFMQELLAGPTSNSAATINSANYPSFRDYQGSLEPRVSPPVMSNTQPAGLQGAIQQDQGMNPTGRPTFHLQQGTGINEVPSTIPQRVYEGFQPTMSSTPTIVNGGLNGFPVNPQGGALPSHIYSIGGLASQLHVNPIMSFSGNDPGSTVQPQQSSPLQTTCEYSSVPYHLQQDLAGVSQQHSSPSPSVALREGGRHGHSRRLSLDPCTRLKVEKLEVALRYLGFKPTEEQHYELRQKLTPNSEGFVSYGDFVKSARQIFALELKDYSVTNSAVQFAVQDIHTSERESFVQMQQQSQQLASLEAIARQSAADVERVTRERDEALREVQHLKKLLKKKEESFLTTEEELIKARQQAQGLLEKSQLLEKRVHLASEAQKAANDVEQDYTEVIRLLEKELDAHRSRETTPKPDVELQELQKRLVVLGCQLRKAEVSKRTYEVATEKLIHFAEMVHECLTQGGVERSQQQGKGQSVRRDSRANPKPPTYLSRHAKYTPASLANEARETVKSVKTIIEEEPLPFGWEEAFTSDGVRYYINHVTQQTSWLHPVSQVQHLPPIVESEEKIRETST